MALATVAGLATNADGNLVALQLSGGGVRLTAPYDLDLVARCSHPATVGRIVVTVIVLVIAAFAAVIGWRAAQELGADWPLAFLTALGSCASVKLTYQSWERLTGPRRFRV